MFNVKTNQEIGSYLKERIIDMYGTQSNFCSWYVDIVFSDSDEYFKKEEIRKMRNRLSQILKGEKGIQISDLPVFSKLLELSCEDILSAGETKLPILNRITNYNIAFSKDEKDWIDYLNNENHIAPYLDEYGKSVVDYAFEFDNYELLKFLTEHKKISFVSNIFNSTQIGAFTTLRPENYHIPTLEDVIHDRICFRDQMIKLAIKNNDIFMLEEMKAKLISSQLQITLWNIDLKINEFYDEELVNLIANSTDDIFNYFCEKYTETVAFNMEVEWLYPYLDEIINVLLETNKERANTLLVILINHNEEVLKKIKSSIYDKAKNSRKLSQE